MFESIKGDCREALTALAPGSRDVLVVSSGFDLEINDVRSAGNWTLTEDSLQLLRAAVKALKSGGLLFIYGAPFELAVWGEHIALNLGRLERSGPGSAEARMVFKYWIGLDIGEGARHGFLQASHMGLLMFLKSDGSRGSDSRFHLNTGTVRVPHKHCSACGRTLKDWGGKKHLMHPAGAALSDVWHDLPRRVIQDSIIPSDVIERIGALTKVDGGSYLHLIQTSPAIERSASALVRSPCEKAGKSTTPDEGARAPVVEVDAVLETDCISYLDKLANAHPHGVFDLAFADPPYNLQKLYGNYADAVTEQRYVEWCNRWLEGMARTLKSGGSLFVLNLPKWCIHHAAFLIRHLEFRHWIVWDAMSDPRGKLMPAHYGLLWFTKPGAKPVVNYTESENGGRTENVLPPDSPRYCLRAGCVSKRKRAGDDEKVAMSDIWFDIHRIKHRRDRDAHPCQLPEKLLERIIRLTTRPGGLVFDPFCGTGTTAIVAARLDRRFVVTDVDAQYIRITREKLAAMRKHADLFGDLIVPRETTRKRKRDFSKREVELYLQDLAKRLSRSPEEADVLADNAEMLKKIDAIYPYRSAALKRAKVALGV